MRWLRTTSRQPANSVIGVSPVRRHQPRLMSLLAGSLAVEKVRSAAERRALRETTVPSCYRQAQMLYPHDENDIVPIVLKKPDHYRTFAVTLYV